MNIFIRHNIFIRSNQIKRDRPSIWLLHGFGDSGLAYKEVFESPLNEQLNIYIPDLAGFGVSPIHPQYITLKEQATLLARILKEESQQAQKINLLAHSIGALIGTWICQELGERINFYFNIEGNLTEADSYFSSKPLGFDSAAEFATSFQKEIFELAKLEERYKRYYSSLRFADPEGMRIWSLTSQEHIKDNRCGFEFMGLSCRKIYLWGDKDTTRESQDFIKEHNIPNKLYKGIGHWHMIENSQQLYQDIHEMIDLS
ncbi:MAG: alpha/beta fold hydrolase [Bacteroidota bacterium]